MAVNKITLNVFEVLDKVSVAKKKSDKVSILQQNDSSALRTVLQGCYHPKIHLELPEGNPPYTPSDGHNAPSTLNKRWKDFGYFSPASVHKLGKVKVERMFIQLLEAIHPKDAMVVLQMKDKKPFKGISSALVKETFPTLIPS
jgi:hypothetical protein